MNERAKFQLPLLDASVVVVTLFAIMIFEFWAVPGQVIASLAA